ncbi:MAG TPA: RNA methyltransferase [bacterium]|nr:RNA methyltransferase [bacterium]
MKPRAPIYLALIHHPVYNQAHDVVCTSITPFDIHDIARTCKTFGITKYFIVCPVESQRKLAQRIMDHWLVGVGAEMNVTRKEAFELVSLVPTLEDACLTIQNEIGSSPRLVGTSAKRGPKRIGYRDFQNQLQESEDSHLLLFGTGWGMTEELLEKTQAMLEPIGSQEDGSYNHLPVRAAVAITLDRLFER